MLDAIRKKKGSFWAKSLLIGVALTFVGGFSMLGYFGKQETSRQSEANRAATVNDTIITLSDVTRLATAMKARYKLEDTQSQWIKTKEDALTNLINNELVYEEAIRQGINISDDEVQKEITTAFQVEGVFDPERYRQFVQRQGYTEETFVEEVRKELAVRRMQDIIGGGATFTEADLMQVFRNDNEQVEAALIAVDPETITKVTQPTTTEIKARFDENAEGYTIPEKRQINWTCFDSVKLGATAQVTEEAILAYYEQFKNAKFAEKPLRLHARVIYFKADQTTSPEDRAKIKEKASQVLSEARLGTLNFENLAATYSEDLETKDKGGDLGWLDLGIRRAPLNKIMNLKPGELSDVIEDFRGYWLFKLEEVQPGKYKPLSQVRKEIIAELRKKAGGEEAAAAAASMLDNVREGKTYEEAAKMATAEVHLTDFFDQTAKKIGDMPHLEQLSQATFKLYQENQVSDIIPVESGACLVQIVKIDDKHDATFEEATQIVSDELLEAARKKNAKESADDILKKIKEGTAFEKAGTGVSGAKYLSTGYFTRRQSYVPNVGYSEAMVTAAFSVPAHDPIGPEVYEAGGKYYIIKITGRKAADFANFEKDKPMLKLRLTYKRRDELVNSWIETLKARAKIDRKTMSPEMEEPPQK